MSLLENLRRKSDNYKKIEEELILDIVKAFRNSLYSDDFEDSFEKALTDTDIAKHCVTIKIAYRDWEKGYIQSHFQLFTYYWNNSNKQSSYYKGVFLPDIAYSVVERLIALFKTRITELGLSFSKEDPVTRKKDYCELLIFW